MSRETSGPHPAPDPGHNLHPLSPPPCPTPILPSLHPTKGAVARHRAAGCGGGFREASPSRAGAPGGRAVVSPPSQGTSGRDAQNPRARSRAARDRRCIDTSTSTLDIGTRLVSARHPAPRIPFRGYGRETPRPSGRSGVLVRGALQAFSKTRRHPGLAPGSIIEPCRRPTMDPGAPLRCVRDDGADGT